MDNTPKRTTHSEDSKSRSPESRDRADVLFGLSAAAQAELSPETGRLLRVNRKMCTLTGFSEEELLERTLMDLLPEKQRKKLGDVFPWKQPEPDAERVDSVRFVRKDGMYRELELYSAGCGNPVRRVLLMAEDVTERHVKEIEVRKAHEQVDAVHKLKNDFLSHVSHELRTPIGGIMGMTEVLLHRVDDEELQQFLSVIRESARSLLFIVEDILDLANIENGKLQLRAMEFDLQQELERTVGLFSDRAREKHLKLSLRLSMDIPRHVYGDPRRLSQVLRNLVENAIEYTEDGEVTVSARRSGEEEGYANLEFSVVDTGPGIPIEDEKFLFTEFGRLKDVYTKRSKEGTGLGLAISRKLVEMMGGEIRYRKNSDRGSFFTFTVRLKSSRPGKQEHEESETVSNSLSSLPPLRILMAEDNLINRMFLGMMLKDAGHTIVEAENGAQAVSMVRDAFENGNPFDLILMDVQMPEMNGMEATRKIRQMKGAASLVPIIAITAFAMKSDEERFISAGMDGYVTKPVDFEELADTIMKLTEADYLDEA